MPSATTLLGLVKHATFVEKVWFDEAVTCRSRAEIGIPATPTSRSSSTTPTPWPRSSRPTARRARPPAAATAPLGVDDVVRGNRRGPLPLRWVYLHMLREIAQHCGHADILREQVLAARPAE